MLLLKKEYNLLHRNTLFLGYFKIDEAGKTNQNVSGKWLFCANVESGVTPRVSSVTGSSSIVFMLLHTRRAGETIAVVCARYCA